MDIPRWTPCQTVSKPEQYLLSRLKRTRKLFAFLRLHRDELFDEAFQAELATMYRATGAGKTPCPPALLAMASLLQGYAYCVGVPSSRKIEKRTQEDIAFRVVAGNTQPDHSSISEFRRIHLTALSALFVQVLKLCQAAGLVKLGHVVIDGTKVKANASKHKAMSYDRMQSKEDELCQRVQELMEAAEQADQSEDAQYGKGRRGDELPSELERAETRRERIRELREQLEQEARRQRQERQEEVRAAAAREETQEPVAAPTPKHQVPADKEGTPQPQAQRNFTDGDSRIMKMSDGFVQGYNCQVAVDEQTQIIVAQLVTNQPPDSEHLLPVLDQVIELCGAAPSVTIADAGYFSESNVLGAYERGTDPHIATGRRKHDEVQTTTQGRPGRELTLKETMARKLETKKGRQVYLRRKVIVEPAFGQLKNRGFRQFLLRGIEKVSGGWSLMALTHNLLKLYRFAGAV